MRDGVARDSFAEIEQAYRQHKERLLTLAAAIVGDRASAEDVVHDVFGNLARRRAGPADPGGWGAYLTICARNRALSVIRGRETQTALAEGQVQAPRAERSGDPSERAARAEDNGVLLRLVAELPDEEREVLALRIWGEMGFREIAVLQQVTKSTAHARYTQALERLKRRLAGGTGNE